MSEDYIFASKEDIQDQKFSIDVEKMISSLKEVTLADRERLYRDMLQLNEKDKVVFDEHGNIIGFKPHKSIEYISFKVRIDSSGVSLDV